MESGIGFRVGEVTPDSKGVAPLGNSRYDLTIAEPADAQRARELQRIVMESEKNGGHEGTTAVAQVALQGAGPVFHPVFGQ